LDECLGLEATAREVHTLHPPNSTILYSSLQESTRPFPSNMTVPRG
jgi:hypothetical protein